MMINFNINTQKSVEAVLWIISEGENNIYNIMKILFEADKYSLNNYSFPVTGDQYIIKQYGTVPNWVYNSTFLKDFDFVLSDDKHLLAKRTCDLNMLSDSDIESLKVGFSKYAGRNFNEVLNLNHDEFCYKKNCKSGIGTIIPFEDMIDDNNPNKQTIINDLSAISDHMVI